MLSVLVLSGCPTTRSYRGDRLDKLDLDSSIKQIEESEKILGDSVDILKDTGESINNSADSIESSANKIVQSEGANLPKIVNNEVPIILGEVESLRNDAEGIGEVQDQLNEATNDLSDTIGQLKEEKIKSDNIVTENGRLLSEIDNKNEKIRELREESSRRLRSQLNWIIVASIIGIGICFTLSIFLRSRVALLAAFTLAAVMGVSIAVQMWMEIIAFVTVGIAVIAGGYLAWKGYQQTNELNQQNKAFNQVVQTSEVAKEYLTPEARRHVFGQGPEKGQADVIQDESTRILVKVSRESPSVNTASSEYTNAWKPPFFD